MVRVGLDEGGPDNAGRSAYLTIPVRPAGLKPRERTLTPQPHRSSESISTVQRRHVIYAEGYDPRGAEGYYRLFQRECDRFRREWPVALTLQPLEFDSDHFAHWRVAVRAANWQVATHYDFLRLERFIRSDMAAPMARFIPRTVRWIVDEFVSGALLRIFCAAPRFSLHLLYFQLLVLAWLALPAMGGLLVAHALTVNFGLPMPIGIATSLLAAFTCLLALRPIADRRRVIQIASCWVTLRKLARGRATWLDQVIDASARHLIAVAQANEADELALVGHSAGGVIASAVMARALELDVDLGRRGPRLVLLTLGSVMPAVALHPAARRMRDIVGRLAIEPTLAWIDCQSRKDYMSFPDFDPVKGVGVDVGAQRCNPLIWLVRFKDMIWPERYRRFTWNLFRVHYQYIMAGDRPAPYDYILLVGGPVAIAEWARRHQELTPSFIRNGIFGSEACRPDDVMMGTDP
jgi:pimeloyl-ACP methyl ester carboxylesterase